MGGRSSEHEVSLASARSVIEALDPQRYEVRPIEISQEGRWDDPAPFEEIDVAFPVLHGPFGEDGTVQGMLEVAGVAYVGSGVAASALCMDKDLFKAVLRDKGIPVPASLTARRAEQGAIENPFGLPVVIKPARLGSSVGITIARTAGELEHGIALAFEHDEKILLEEYISGIEVECGVLGNESPVASLPGEIVLTSSDWYDYSAKYDEGGMELIVPARIPAAAAALVQALAVRSFTACDCEGMARVDFFVRENGEVIVSELNTIPGFTATSVYAKLFEASGVPYRQLVDRLFELALNRRERRASLRY
jgi:D-alanine-D-alanine ligase